MGERARKAAKGVTVDVASSPPAGSVDWHQQRRRKFYLIPEPATRTEKIKQDQAWHEHVCDRADLSNAWRYSWRAAWMKALAEVATNLGFVPGSEGYGGRGDFELELRAYWEGTRAPSENLPSATTTAVREMSRKQLEALALNLLDAGWWHARHDMLERRESSEQSVEGALSLASYGLRRKRAADGAWRQAEERHGHDLRQVVQWTIMFGTWVDEHRDQLGGLLAYCIDDLNRDREELNRVAEALRSGRRGARYGHQGKVLSVVRGLALMGDPCWKSKDGQDVPRPSAASRWLENNWGIRCSRETLQLLLKKGRQLDTDDEQVERRIVEYLAVLSVSAASTSGGRWSPRECMKEWMSRGEMRLQKKVWGSDWLAKALGEVGTTAG